MDSVMIDLESLALTADAVIMSLGAVRFDSQGSSLGDRFYASISIDSNLEHRRRINESTIVWWMQQERLAQNVFHEPKVHLDSALADFSGWMSAGGDGTLVWSNGADFDLPMLAHAYRTVLDDDPPWHFPNTRCVRTLKNLPGMKDVRPERAGVYHNALDDAVYQAQLVQAIQRTLGMFLPSEAAAA